MTLTSLTFADLLRAFRSSDPTPGGGSASALAGAVGASLLTMVAGLPKPRAATLEDAARLAAAGSQSAQLSDRLAGLVDHDSDAYNGVVCAFRLPKASDMEKASRTSAIQEALTAATDTPLAVMRAAAAAIEEAMVIAQFCNRNASSDVLVALELLGAAVRGARRNVDSNLPSLRDAAYVERTRQEGMSIEEAAGRGIAAARLALDGPG